MSKLAKALTAAAGNAGGTLGYVEDVFSTYLYTGTGSALDITNNIDLSGEGGAVWIKNRTNVSNHALFDTERGAEKLLFSDDTAAEQDRTADNDSLGAFNADGFSLQASTGNRTNESGSNFASWTFRKAEKFFDVVTYTGTGTAQTIAHNLGVAPAVVIVKAAAGTNAGIEFWAVYHASLGATKLIRLNTTDAAVTSNSLWNDTAPTDTHFTVNNNGAVNNTGLTYVAYLFASDAGGFGDDGDESIIKCGSFNTGSGTGSVELGFEPQWVLVKWANGVGDWYLVDVMRGFDHITSYGLSPNTSGAEQNIGNFLKPTATGFAWNAGASRDYIYIAIRRPMKTPESGTEVFTPTFGTGSGFNFIAGFPVDMAIIKDKDGVVTPYASARLNSGTLLSTASTAAELANAPAVFDSQVGYYESSLGSNYIGWMFKRATGFFDVVAYTGDGTTNRSIAHNLGVTPELIIYKSRSDGTRSWIVWQKDLNSEYVSNDFYLKLESTNGVAGSNFWDGPPTSSTFQLSGDASDNEINGNGQTYIAYLFATLDGVSKVGSYTGTGADLNVDCGFSAGARFILIKRTDSTGDWYTYDSVRGISAGNDPYLLLNTTAAEVTGTDYIDPLSSGFTVTSTAPAALNASGGTYIFLAIA